MNCLECQELLQQRLDGEIVRESESLDRHLNDCVACREQHVGAARLLEGLRELPRPQPPVGFARLIGESVLRDRRQRRAKLRRRVFVTTALAASVMAILLLGYFWLPRPHGPGSGPVVKKEMPKKPTPPEKEQVPDQHVKKSEPRSPLTPLMDRWADTTRDHAKVVLIGTNLDAVENLPAVDKLPPIDPGVREASQEVSDSVRAVTRNARKAFDFFARELPMPDMTEKNSTAQAQG